VSAKSTIERLLLPKDEVHDAGYFLGDQRPRHNPPFRRARRRYSCRISGWYCAARDEAIARAEALALRVLADRLEHAEAGPDLVSVTFRAA
jgi:hypothetical protein